MGLSAVRIFRFSPGLKTNRPWSFRNDFWVLVRVNHNQNQSYCPVTSIFPFVNWFRDISLLNHCSVVMVIFGHFFSISNCDGSTSFFPMSFFRDWWNPLCMLSMLVISFAVGFSIFHVKGYCDIFPDNNADHVLSDVFDIGVLTWVHHPKKHKHHTNKSNHVFFIGERKKIKQQYGRWIYL